jgi:hydrogenase 3 maturation protease
LVEDLRRALAAAGGGNVIVVGVGNTTRGDDGVGPAVVEELRGTAVAALDVGDAPERYLGPITESGAQVVLFVDAVDFGGGAGEAVLLEEQEVPRRSCVTHRSALGLVMRYVREQAGQRSLLIGVQPASIAPGSAMTPPVRRAAKGIAAAVREVLWAGPTCSGSGSVPAETTEEPPAGAGGECGQR